MYFALKPTNSVTFGPLRCSSPISSGLLSPESDRSDLRTFEVLLHEVAQKKLGRSTSTGPKVTKFVAFNAKYILLGLYWFKENGHTVTINSERYIAILDQFHGDLTQKLTQGQLRLAWFIQDGARPHTAHASLKHLRVFFKNCLISLNTDHEWAPHSPDLITLDV